jgi:hypothetical protein
VHDTEDFDINLIYVCLLIISIIKLFITKIRVMSHPCQKNKLRAEHATAGLRHDVWAHQPRAPS